MAFLVSFTAYTAGIIFKDCNLGISPLYFFMYYMKSTGDIKIVHKIWDSNNKIWDSTYKSGIFTKARNPLKFAACIVKIHRSAQY